MQSLFDFGADQPRLEESQQRGIGVSRSWCDPRRHTEIVGADVGCGYVNLHSLRSGYDHDKIHVSQFINAIPLLPKGSLLVCEDAHLAVPQTQKSLAQPWTAGDLLAIYRACEERGITIRMFPHAHTTKVRLWSAANAPSGLVDAEKSSDINDARALAFFVEHNNSLSLVRPRMSFDRSPIREYGRAVRGYSNTVLNASRSIGYGSGKFRHIEAVASRLRLIDVSGVRFIDNEMSSLSVASLVCHELEGRPVRFTYRGLALGARSWMRHVLAMTPCHHRGGVARSNLMRWRYPSYLRGVAGPRGVTLRSGPKLLPFHELTKEQVELRREETARARTQLRQAYREAVALSAGFEPLEVLDHGGNA